MKICEKCKKELRGKRMNYDIRNEIFEFFCQNKECSEFEVRVDPKNEIEVLMLENAELKERLRVIEDRLLVMEKSVG
jgi:hypothetical protein